MVKCRVCGETDLLPSDLCGDKGCVYCFSYTVEEDVDCNCSKCGKYMGKQSATVKDMTAICPECDGR